MTTGFIREVSGIPRYRTPAACAYFFQSEVINPRKFNPFLPLLGGTPLIQISGIGTEDGTGRSVLVAEDWMNHSCKAGASIKNSLLCLAANFDQYPGVIILALYMAMIALNGKSDKEMQITPEEYSDLVEMLWTGNVGNVYELLQREWPVLRKDGVNYKTPPKLRSQWEEELGHRVLLHPFDLEPCRDKDGLLILETMEIGNYDGVFLFKRNTGETFESADFPPLPT